MEIISHRGYWKSVEEKNKKSAFENSFSLDFGTETDFRDFCGQLVVSHDIASSESITVELFFKIYNKHEHRRTLALNIKSDGLQAKIKEAVQKYDITDYFVFDMSIPDTIGYINLDINFYSRQSEYEPKPAFYSECKGVWLDAFNGTWYDNEVILEHIANKKKVAIVSPELHKRGHLKLWEQLKADNLYQLDDIILCTDLPEDAQSFFQN